MWKYKIDEDRKNCLFSSVLLLSGGISGNSKQESFFALFTKHLIYTTRGSVN